MNQRRVRMVQGFSKRLAQGLLAALLVAVLSAAPAAAQELPTLTGETFTGFPSGDAFCFTGHIDYQVSGTATGPYPGNYTEKGSIDFGPPDPVTEVRSVTGFSASFSINSAVATVTGTKALRPDPSNFGICRVVSGPPGTRIVAKLSASYVASITPTSGEGQGDEGIANVSFSFHPASFSETFTSAEDIEEADEDDDGD